MARLKELEKEILTLYQGRLKSLFQESPAFIFSCPKEEVFRRGAVVGSEVFCFERLSRALDKLRELLRKGPSFREGTVVIAEELSAAKGRFDRPWWASKGGLWLAIAFYHDFLPEIRGFFPLYVGVALAETLWHYYVPARIKWVNDLWLAGRKLAGILIEEEVLSDESWALVGVGLNINNNLPAGLPAISVKDYLGQEIPLSQMAAEILVRLTKYYGLLRTFEARLLREEKSLPLQEPFLFYSDTVGRKVYFGEDLFREEQGQGQVLGLDPKGGLVIKTFSGETITLFSGEIAYLD